MSLEKWVEHGWLRREPTSPGEIKDLLGIVERSLADAKVGAVSTDLRFIAAFNAALCVATTALRASGHLRALGFANDQLEHLLESCTFVDHRDERVRIKPCGFCRVHESLDRVVGRDVMRFVKNVKNGFNRVAGLDSGRHRQPRFPK